MKKYQIKLRIWLMLGILFGSFLSQPMTALAITNNQGQSEKTESVQNEQENVPNIVEQFLQKDNLIRGENGKLYTTTPSTYVNESIHDILSGDRLTKAANQVVYVDPSTNVANIDIHLSNGSREYGWYGKRVNGQIALCIEQGVALNVGSNGGYTAVLQDTELMKRISLIKYYGIILPGHTLQREIMTQILAYEQQGIYPTSISGIFSMADYQVFKTNVMTNVNKFYTKPSFDGRTITLKVGESITLTDTTGAFSNYESMPFGNSAGVSVRKENNSLTITANRNSNEKGSVGFAYAIPANYQGVPVVYTNPFTQNVVLGRASDPTRTTVNINVLKNGNARIRKIDETTKQPLAGAVFRFTTSDGQSREITTGSDGYATWNDLLVDTRVTIQEIKAPNGYILNSTPQTITIRANETTTVTMDNKEQLANLTVIKEDEETGNTPQGAAQLIGAVYELTDGNGATVGQLTMEDVNGVAQAELKGLKLGTYYLQEIEPPEGYNLDPTKYTVQLTYAGQNETVAIHSRTVTDRVIKGHVEGYKFGSRPLIPQTITEILNQIGNKNQDIKPPLEGVELTATSHTTGQEYVQVTGKNGYFKFENLPYDTYTIEETKGVDGYLLIEPFVVTITEEGYTHFFLLEDKIIESRLHIVKVDEETGENIPYAGAQFKIFDTWANEGEGDFVSMQRPNDTESTDIFETNEKGEIVTTESLAWGIDRYELHEIKAPEGYVPLEEPLVFSVTEEDAGALIRLEVPNRLARQNIQLIKRDRLNEQPLANVPFNLFKLETDEAGESTEVLLDEYLTDEAGEINIEGLPYGEYKFVEGEPLEGYLPLEESIDFSVTVEKDGELIVLEAFNEREQLELMSLFTDMDGKKELDPTVDHRLKDTVWVKGAAIEIGHTYTVFTQYKNTTTGEVVSEATSTYTAKSKEDEFDVFLDLKGNTVKDGDQLTATHVLYYEEDQLNEVAREDDLTNKEQTVNFKTPEQPKENKSETTKKQTTLPKTGSVHTILGVVLGGLLVTLVIFVWLSRAKK
ncbi:SpaA isopeptide-forming pilin-related protein [Enterococcus sp. HMSC076E04]|uniref:SpaA isopeptide-forming pilin-related protein n=1 Tax=Enterococcus sp. HMSC076E04 TaxID=1739465 RepID=UPI0008A50849|nr:SpaA isopeptide-forming pilin-related protein [Enterococcus sp. HMSC076E04]EGP5443454.1 LPXTG cell wall anchor domain-containing protein [Enterococcus faecium]NTM08316.1 LPXTG cell wall anchor domain-containing protein [Enterococcus faecium]OFP98081.1 cell wall protein [Enterococcus sp. HMSC076E04]